MSEELKPCPCGAPAEKEPYAITPSADLFRLDCTRAECGWCVVSPTAEQAFIDWNTRALTQPAAVEVVEVVKLQHMAVAEDGRLRWMSGRKIGECELYAAHDFKAIREPLMTVAQHNRIMAATVPAGSKVVQVELLERAALLLQDSMEPPAGCSDFDDWTRQGNKMAAELRAILEVKP